MLLKINGIPYKDVSRIEIEGAYEIAPEEGLELQIHLYDCMDCYMQSVVVRDIENLIMGAADDE